MAFLCGAGSFSRADDGELWPPSTPVGSKRRRFGAGGGGGGNGNPYSTRGLEKYSMLLVDLETRKEKIVAAAGSQGVALVQFVYSSSGDWVPIVVRPREQPRSPEAKKRRKDQKRPGRNPKERLADLPQPQQQLPPAAEQAVAARDRAVRKSLSWKASVGEGGVAWPWRPSRYLPVAVALVLLCLAVFGRAFAICCTSIWWYAVPIAAAKGGGNRAPRTRPVNEEYGRRSSDRRLDGAVAGGGQPAAQGRRGGGLEALVSPRKQHVIQARREES